MYGQQPWFKNCPVERSSVSQRPCNIEIVFTSNPVWFNQRDIRA
jgi:hypothetical protein